MSTIIPKIKEDNYELNINSLSIECGMLGPYLSFCILIYCNKGFTKSNDHFKNFFLSKTKEKGNFVFKGLDNPQK